MRAQGRLDQETVVACEPGALLADFVSPNPSEYQSLRERMPEDWGFLATEWPKAWAEAYLPYDRWRGPYRCLTIRDADGAVIGVLPLATLAFGPMKFTALAGQFYPYRGPAVVADPIAMKSACEKMVEVLAEKPNRLLGVRMGPIRADEMSAVALVSALSSSGWRIGRRMVGQSFTLSLPPTLLDFNQASKGIIKKVAYYERRLRKRAKLTIKEHRSLDPEAWARVLDDAEAVERNSWVFKERGFLKFNGHNNRKFWLRALSDEYLARAIVIWIMYADQKPISFSLNLDADRTKYILANSHDDAFEEHSPGHILAHRLLAAAIDRQMTCVDWGVGDSGYKQRWLAKPGPFVHDVIALPPGLMSHLLRWLCRGAHYTF